MKRVINEKELRIKLIEIAKRVSQAGLVTGTWGNISAKLSDNEILITPSGFGKSELNPEHLIVIDMNGKVIRGELKPSMETFMHVNIYTHRPDVNAIIHTHSPAATAFAVVNKAIPVITVDFASVVGETIPVAQYARPGTEKLAEVATKTLNKKAAILLRNHGVVAVGNSLDEAFHVAVIVEEAAKIYIYASLIGKPILIPNEEVKAIRDYYLREYGQKGLKFLVKSII
ncbi:MAG: class II aldolase/adducin family protein [Candidatus Methanomethylicaceae archaeon]